MKKPLKVLIVEDERLTAKSLMYDINDLDAEALGPVARGEDAVVVALREHPDLILMDIRLAGGLDGIEAAEKILIEKKIPIVFMTGYATDYVKERVAMEVQFGKYAFVAYDLFVKHLAFYVGDTIDVGIEVLPMKSLQSQMSSGVPYYEGEFYNVIRQGRGVPAVPLVLIGIEP